MGSGNQLSTSTVDFTYQYQLSSGLSNTRDKGNYFSLATCKRKSEYPHFFEGKVCHPREFGLALLVLSDVVQAHFFDHRPLILDPVLTSNECLLRLEGFSGCCGAYARIDLPGDSFETELQGRGTTNVDFNQPMRTALGALRNSDDLNFSVGHSEVKLKLQSRCITEKKVQLPVRWIKGFSEAQAYQKSLVHKLDVTGQEALKFFRTINKSNVSKLPSYLNANGRSIRLSHRPRTDSIQMRGLHRLKVLEPLLQVTNSVGIWYDPEHQTTGWQLNFQSGSFFYMLSPDLYRGFSGEGQLLSEFVSVPKNSTLHSVRAQLKWASEINAKEIAERLACPESVVENAIGLLSTRGLAGYDVTKKSYFHRELPFDLGEIGTDQPRFQSAQNLVDQKRVCFVKDSDGKRYFRVQGTKVVHQVCLAESETSCTCPWYSKYQGKRGPCKHVLAASLLNQELDRGE